MGNFKVYHSIPWNSEKNIGVSYNEMMNIVDDNDWVCFLDGDAVHTTHFFGKRIEEVIKDNPDYNLFTCYTNRIGCHHQLAPNVDRTNNDQKYHREIGETLWVENGTLVMDITDDTPLSGVMILIRKSEWKKVGGFKTTGMLVVDNDIHVRFRNKGMKVGLMKGIYVQHWYRGNNPGNKSHLF